MGYDRYGNIMDSTAKHLTPMAAIEKFGFSIRWISAPAPPARAPSTPCGTARA